MKSTGDSTDLVSAEERSRLAKANLTHGVFQVGINLNLKGKRCAIYSRQVLKIDTLPKAA